MLQEVRSAERRRPRERRASAIPRGCSSPRLTRSFSTRRRCGSIVTASIREQVAGIVASSEMTRRGHSEHHVPATGPNALLDSLRSMDPVDLTFRQSHFDAVLRFCGKAFGQEHASPLTEVAEAAAHSNRRAQRGRNAAVAAQVCEFAGALMSHPLGLRKNYATIPRFAMSRHLLSYFVAFYLAEAVRP